MHSYMTHDLVFAVSASDITTVLWTLIHSLTKAYWCLYLLAHQQEYGVCFTVNCKYLL